MRYELKILFSPLEKEGMLKRIFSHPSLIREIYEERQINNIYFDTGGYSDYLASVNGSDIRKKYRIRWYGALNQEKTAALLELKYKKGMVGGKKIVTIPSFSTTHSFDSITYFQELRQKFPHFSPEEQFMVGELLGRTPTVLNTYTRRYFVTADETFRFTLDENMHFYSLLLDQVPTEVGVDKNLLIEVKFEEENVREARDLIHSLGLRVGKNSKYVNGVNLVLYGSEPLVV